MTSHGKQTEVRIRHAEGRHGGERDSTESRGLQNPLLSQREETMHSPKRTESDWQGLVCEVRAVTHLLSSLLHMGRADSASRKHREISVFLRCALIISIFSWSVLLVCSRDVCVFAMCSPCFYLFLFCVLLVFWRVYETNCSLTIEPNNDYCWEMSTFTLPVLPGPSRHQKFVSWRSREHPCVLAILAGLSLFVLVFSRCLRDAHFFHYLMNEHNKVL